MATQNLDYITGFDAIVVNTFGSVKVKQSDNFSVTVTADDNIMSYIQITKSNQALIVDIDDEYNYKNCRYNVFVEMPEIEHLTANSAGSISTEGNITGETIRLYANSAGSITINLETEKLYCTISSAGSITASGTSNYLYANLESAGNLHAFNLETNRTQVNVSSAGSAYVFVNDYLEANISSVGSVYYKGHPQLSYRISSIGSLIDSN